MYEKCTLSRGDKGEAWFKICSVLVYVHSTRLNNFQKFARCKSVDESPIYYLLKILITIVEIKWYFTRILVEWTTYCIRLLYYMYSSRRVSSCSAKALSPWVRYYVALDENSCVLVFMTGIICIHLHLICCLCKVLSHSTCQPVKIVLP